MGIQIHATDNYRRVVELIQAGAIGPVREAHVWVSRAWGLQSDEDAKRNKDIVFVDRAAEGSRAGAAGLDWDLWLGPAPERPFHAVYVPGPEVVPLVGFRQRHDERPRQPLERSAVLGAEAQSAAHGRSERPAGAPGNRPGDDDAPPTSTRRAATCRR